MNDCQMLRDDLKAYADGELPLTGRMAVRLHLARCASCREELSAMEQITNDLRAADGGALDPALRAKILGSAPDAETAQPTAEPIPRPFWNPRPLTVCCAAAIVLLVGFLIFPAFTPARQKARSTGRPLSGSRMPVQEYDWANRHAAAPQASTARTNPRITKGYSLPAAPSSARRVRKEAGITVEVQGLEAKSDAVEQMVKGAGGFVATSQLSTGDDGFKSASLTLRVPVARFETILSQIAKLGEVKAKNVTGEDITEQVSDAEQEDHVLRNEIRYKEARLQAATDRPGRWQEEQAARDLRVELAQARARLDLLQKTAALSTITVALREKSRAAIQSGGFLGEMSDTGRLAVSSFLRAARLPILLLIWIAAYAPLWVPLAIAYRYAVRMQQHRTRAHSAQESQRTWSPAPEREGAPR